MGKKELLKMSLRNCWYGNIIATLLMVILILYQRFFYDVPFSDLFEQIPFYFIVANLSFIVVFAFVWGDKIKGWQGWLIGLPAFVALVYWEEYLIV